ncbi:M20/M25/M40 family metallo-hydrolase [Novosphingobium sp. Fuku2-ISO-50]|uniref:M20/M25/M40 family metallo-hydrolase n=1 Tax=Novosphingobium sp. Fuku2-ISO-50 TaxID=1739114 RepID=UPI00076C794D|nr:M20/M25/M40 family metallo-hydrolase [Novosphingobium sp. Fuku2-ISO-50]KUR74754.1 peptidase M20 [Novosphingobium sp. Fuku2-ISO-50]
MIARILAGTALAAVASQTALAAEDPGEAAFRATYKELVETNTTLSSGSCTLAAQRMGAHLKAAGFADDQIVYYATPEHPKEGGLVAILPGTSAKAKPILLLAHLDVVEAKRADWTRDPFTLIEEGGYFWARGTLDDKAMASVWVDTMARLKAGKVKLKRTLKLALTCGEETSGAFNGAQWLAANKRDLIDAEFALNEGGGGRTDGKALAEGGHIVAMSVQVGEKAAMDYRVETRNPGGHSSIPVKDNAIYELSDALLRLRDYDFPAELNDTTRAFFGKAGAVYGGTVGQAMQTVATAKPDSDGFKQAVALLDHDRSFHSTLRTTCVATMLSGGHATNALPQRAGAIVNCRIFPGHSFEEVRADLSKVFADPGVTVTTTEPDHPIAKAPPMDPQVIRPIEMLTARYFPGVPLVPTMSTGATDGIYLEAKGIPTYGVPGIWANPDLNGIHGLNEHLEVASLLKGRAFLYDLVQAYAK